MTLSSEAKMTGDLFEVDKRLALKPIVDFNSYLRAAFADGPCSCGRCVASQGDESGYDYQHTFNFAGRVANRRFASTAGSDVLQALKKAWLPSPRPSCRRAAIWTWQRSRNSSTPNCTNCWFRYSSPAA